MRHQGGILVTIHEGCLASDNPLCPLRSGSGMIKISWPQRYGPHWMPIPGPIAEFRSAKARYSTERKTSSGS